MILLKRDIGHTTGYLGPGLATWLSVCVHVVKACGNNYLLQCIAISPYTSNSTAVYLERVVVIVLGNLSFL